MSTSTLRSMTLTLVLLTAACVEPPRPVETQDMGATDLNIEDMKDMSETDVADMTTVEDMDERDMPLPATPNPCNRQDVDVATLIGRGASALDPKWICSREALILLRSEDTAGQFYKLGANIDLGGTQEQWTPVPCFEGHLDGDNRTISNLAYKENDTDTTTRGCLRENTNDSIYYGLLFNEVRGGTLKRMTFDKVSAGQVATEVNLELNAKWFGGILGRLSERSVLEDVTITGASIYSPRNTAVLAARVNTSTMNRVIIKDSDITLSSGGASGFVFAVAKDSSISNIHVQGSIQLNTDSPTTAGMGLVGGLAVDSSLNTISAVGSVTSVVNSADIGKAPMGMILGEALDGDVSLTQCAAINNSENMFTQNISTNKGRYAAGLIGFVPATNTPPNVSISDCGVYTLSLKNNSNASFIAAGEQANPNFSATRIFITDSNIVHDELNAPDTPPVYMNSSAQTQSVCIQQSGWKCGDVRCEDDDDLCTLDPSGFKDDMDVKTWVELTSKETFAPKDLWEFLEEESLSDIFPSRQR